MLGAKNRLCDLLVRNIVHQDMNIFVAKRVHGSVQSVGRRVGAATFMGAFDVAVVKVCLGEVDLRVRYPTGRGSCSRGFSSLVLFFSTGSGGNVAKIAGVLQSQLRLEGMNRAREEPRARAFRSVEEGHFHLSVKRGDSDRNISLRFLSWVEPLRGSCNTLLVDTQQYGHDCVIPRVFLGVFFWNIDE